MMVLLVLIWASSAFALAPVMQNDDPVPGRYIVQIKRYGSVVDVIKSLEDQIQQEPWFTPGLNHFRTLSVDSVANMAILELDYKCLDMVSKNPKVEYIEEDAFVDVKVDDPPDEEDLSERQGERPGGYEYDRSRWGLDRINQENRPLDTNWTVKGTGFGVHIYIIDSGLTDTHRDFECRADRVFDVFGEDGADCKGHGTRVAGIAAGKTYGVATDARIHSVRVLDCNGVGYKSNIAKGIEWVAQNHVGPCVVTLSFSTPPSQKIDEAVKDLAKTGCIPVTAASNELSPPYNYNACGFSPCRSPYALTVGATTETDDRASFSRYGTCVDIFAPGNYIRTTSAKGGSSFVYASGTAIAAPYVAGVAAIHLGNGVPVEDLREKILNDATPCVISDCGEGSPNRFLYIDPY